MIKNIDKIKRDFIRLRANELGLHLEVCEIEWHGQTPISTWTCVTRLGTPTAENEGDTEGFHIFMPIPAIEAGSPGMVIMPSDIEKAIKRLLSNRRYFRICGRCSSLNPVGWMHDKFACQSCAEKHLGVVY